MAKKYEAVSPDIRGKITAYKYVLSESLCRAAERSSFGNPLRSFATVVVLRVHCAQSSRPTCATRTYTDRASLSRARQRKKKKIQKETRSCPLADRSVRAKFSRWYCTGYRHVKKKKKLEECFKWTNEWASKRVDLAIKAKIEIDSPVVSD